NYLEKRRILEEKMREKADYILGDGLPKVHSNIRLTRGEEMLASTDTNIYKYKNTGRGGYVGATYRIPTGIKGLNFKVGGGQVAAEKDWVRDGEGAAYITTKAIIIHDGTKAKRLTWGAISDIEVGLDYFHIIPNRGAVIRCVCDFVDSLDFIALLQLESQYQNILSEISEGKLSEQMKEELFTSGAIQSE
ncbi:hypothetical protein AB4353_18755, partial [Vibrio breoganii]